MLRRASFIRFVTVYSLFLKICTNQAFFNKHYKYKCNIYIHNLFQLLHAYRWTSLETTFIRSDNVKGDDVITHAQRNTSNDCVIAPPRDFEHPLRWYCQVCEVENYCCRLRTSGIFSTPNCMKTRSSIPRLLHDKYCSP